MLRNEIKLHETSETGKQDIIQDYCNKVELNSSETNGREFLSVVWATRKGT